MLDKLLLILAVPFLYLQGYRRYQRKTPSAWRLMDEPFLVESLNGTLRGFPGDYLVITGGSRAVVKPNVFRKTYRVTSRYANHGYAVKRQKIWAKQSPSFGIIGTTENDFQWVRPQDWVVINSSLADRYPIADSFFQENYARG